MRILLILLAASVGTAGPAIAQATSTPPPPPPWDGYVEGVAHSAFGNTTSQSYGAEAGYRVRNDLLVFVEFGQMRNVAPAQLTADAQQISESLGQTLANVTFSAREPATFGTAGVRFSIPSRNPKIQPYVLGGIGVARVKKDVTFKNGDADITSQLATYMVVLGSDLSGDFTKAMLTIGGGVVYPIWNSVFADFQFRFSHIGAEEDDPRVSATNVGRAGLGIGIRF